MTAEIFALLLLGCVFHALWNIASRAYRAIPGFLWTIIFWSSVLPWFLFPFVYDSIDWDMSVFGLAIVSGIGLAIYYKFVRISYKEGDISTVYPVIRSSPLWVSLISVLFFGEQMSVQAWIGIGVVLAGIMILPQKGLNLLKIMSNLAYARQAIGYAILASLGTCIYSLSDKKAMDSATDVMAGVSFLCLSSMISMVLWFFIDRGAHQGFEWKRLRVPSVSYKTCIVLGFFVFAAYAITIITMTYAPAGKVLALTNISLVFGSLAGMIFFKERSYLFNRIIGLILVLIGITLIKVF